MSAAAKHVGRKSAAVGVAILAITLLAAPGCAAPLARKLASRSVERAVEAAAADDGIPSAASVGLASTAAPD